MKWILAIAVLIASVSIADEDMDAAGMLSLYGAVWNQTDPRLVDDLLERCWSESGTYTDPTTSVTGRTGLAAYVRDFQRQFPGAQLVWTSRVDAHHRWFRVSWAIVGSKGDDLLTGEDVGQLDADGRILRVVGFFDPASAVK